MQASSNSETAAYLDDCPDVDEATGACMRITIRGGDEICHASYETNDNLDLGYPNMDGAWTLTYTRSPCGESALVQALRRAGVTRTGVSGIRVIVIANGQPITDQAAADSAGLSTSSHEPVESPTDGGVAHVAG